MRRRTSTPATMCATVRSRSSTAGAQVRSTLIEPKASAPRTPPQAILDRVIHVLGIDVDESRREIDDQRLEAEAFPTLDREVALLHIRRKRVRRYYVHAQSPSRGRIKGM